MPEGYEHFNLEQTMHSVGIALQAVTGHIFFDAALHGLIIALVIALVGLVLLLRKQKYGQPLTIVAGKLSIACLIMMLPGFFFLLKQHQLPSTGVFHINSLGFIVFWVWISLHLSAEEINFESVKN